MRLNIKKIGIFSSLISLAFVLSGCFHAAVKKEPLPLKKKGSPQQNFLPPAADTANTNANVAAPKKIKSDSDLDALLNDLEKTEELSDAPVIDDSDIDNF